LSFASRPTVDDTVESADLEKVQRVTPSSRCVASEAAMLGSVDSFEEGCGGSFIALQAMTETARPRGRRLSGCMSSFRARAVPLEILEG
jgi:hypothetical protein